MVGVGVGFLEGMLTLVPYGDQSITANGYTYTAPSQAQYDLTDDDFVLAGSNTDPVRLIRKLARAWEQAARWPGPEDDRGYRDAIDQGMLSEGPAAIRERVREWLTSLLRLRSASFTMRCRAALSGFSRVRPAGSRSW